MPVARTYGTAPHDQAPHEHHAAMAVQHLEHGAGHPRMAPEHAAHEGHAAHGGHGGHDRHAGHDPEMFRGKFWRSLALSLPIVATCDMVMDWLGYSLQFPGVTRVGPVLGSGRVLLRRVAVPRGRCPPSP